MEARKKTPSPPARIESRLGRPWQECVQRAHRHTMAVQLWLSTRSPNAARYQGMGVEVGSTGLQVPLLNLALGCCYPPDVSERDLEDEIEGVKAFLERREVPWYWWIGPQPSPSDAGQRLRRHGLTFRSALPAMVVPLPARQVPVNPDVQVWVASSRADLEAASTIRRRAFRFPPEAAEHYFEDMASDWLGGTRARLYLARLKGSPPASIAALVRGSGLPGVYVMATLPEFGRRGLATAILSHLLRDAEAQGHSLAVLTASDYGYPLYRKFGFEHLFDYSIYKPLSHQFQQKEQS